MKFTGIFVKNVSDLVTMQSALSQFSHKSKYCMEHTTGPLCERNLTSFTDEMITQTHTHASRLLLLNAQVHNRTSLGRILQSSTHTAMKTTL